MNEMNEIDNSIKTMKREWVRLSTAGEKAMSGKGIMFIDVNQKTVEGGFVGGITGTQQMHLLEALRHHVNQIEESMHKRMEGMMDEMPNDLKGKLKDLVKELAESIEKGEAKRDVEEIDLELDVPKLKNKKADYIG